jgi:hypothetical protein
MGQRSRDRTHDRTRDRDPSQPGCVPSQPGWLSTPDRLSFPFPVVPTGTCHWIGVVACLHGGARAPSRFTASAGLRLDPLNAS